MGAVALVPASYNCMPHISYNSAYGVYDFNAPANLRRRLRRCLVKRGC
jgi:hypothetical protein